MNDMYLVQSWKWYSPFPRWGCPEGYSRKRSDYRDDFESLQPYINRYRAVTERRSGIGGGDYSSYYSNIRGFILKLRAGAGCHKRRMNSLKGRSAGIKGVRQGLRYGAPWTRSGSVGRVS